MKRTIIAAVAAGVIGIGIGAAGASANTPAPKTITDTSTVQVEATPQSCVEALDLADTGFGYAGQGMQAVADVLDAVTRFDVDGITAATVDITDATDLINGMSGPYHEARDACRASA